MSRIKQAFAHKAKIAYLTAGDGGAKASLDYFLALIEGGTTLLEVGIPYSDPIADGAVIQQAMQRSLSRATDISHSLQIIAQIRQVSEVAIIAFTYYNPVQADLVGFLRQLKNAGADGVLIVDLPYEEAEQYYFYCKQLDLASICVIAPSTPAQRMRKLLANVTSGFIYYACRKGTTGARNDLPIDLADQVMQIRQFSQLPIAVGFGIANAQMVEQILDIADGCVVGSYLVQQVANQVSPTQLTKVVHHLWGE
ncbi:MAG: hypothetical protein RLZZ293_410 [Pseudomonadota bacterium]|jgi:tryptophan synthase alpha chain